MPEAYVHAVASHLPERVMTNDELAEIVDTSDEWIYSHTGIRRRYIAAPEEAASDLGAAVARKAIGRTELSASDIDLILLATSTPDYPGLPATASIVQEKIGAENAGAMDLVAACSGFVYGLETARAMIRGGGLEHVLVIGSEVYTRILNWEDRGTCVLFGDGAGAAVVSRTDDAAESRIVDSYLRSRGSGAETLYRPAGGSRRPYVEGKTPPADRFLFMDGRQVYNFAVGAVAEAIQATLDKTGLTFEAIDHVVPHQANVRIIKAAAKRAGLDFGKFYTNIERYANTSAASIPIALTEMVDQGILTRGHRVLTVGFGSGLAYGANLIVW
mgnify:CR=1 FL=1